MSVSAINRTWYWYESYRIYGQFQQLITLSTPKCLSSQWWYLLSDTIFSTPFSTDRTLMSRVRWSYPRNMDTGLSEVLVFKLFRTEAATPTVPPPPIVITFDIIKYRCPHYFPADKVFSMDTFHFQRMKEAFHADYAASVAPDNLLNSTGLHGPCER